MVGQAGETRRAPRINFHVLHMPKIEWSADLELGFRCGYNNIEGELKGERKVLTLKF